jgi:hypothetical protein
MVPEHQDDPNSQWAAIVSIAEKIGCAAETLRHGAASVHEFDESAILASVHSGFMTRRIERLYARR